MNISIQPFIRAWHNHGAYQGPHSSWKVTLLLSRHSCQELLSLGWGAQEPAPYLLPIYPLTRELNPSLTNTGIWDPDDLQHRKTGPTPHLKEGSPSGQNDQLSSQPGTHPATTPSWHTPTTTPSMTCWNVWRIWSCRAMAIWSTLLERQRDVWGILERGQCWWCSSQRPWTWPTIHYTMNICKEQCLNKRVTAWYTEAPKIT